MSFNMLNEPISDDEQVGLSKKQLLKLKKTNNQAKQPQSNQQPNNQAKQSQSNQQPNNQAKQSQPNNKNDKIISPKKDSEKSKKSEDSDESESSYDPFEEAKKRAQAKILSTTTINLNSSLESNPRLESKTMPESNPDFNLSPRELFKKALSYDDDNQNMLAIKYYILCIKKYLEENKIITMKFIRTVRNAFGNLAILLDIEEIKTDFIEIGYKFGICGGNYNLLQCYAEYFRNKAYLLEYLLISKLEPTSEDFILWKELTEESLFKELSLYNHDILNEKLKLINH